MIMIHRSTYGLLMCIALVTTTLSSVATAQSFDLPAGPYGGTPASFNQPDGFFDLSQADTGSWMEIDPAGDGPDGVFDPDLRLVVYRFEDLIFPNPPGSATYTYTFKNHITNCPVVFLVEGDFELPEGVTLSLDGEDTLLFQGPLLVNQPALPGPGGFRGGHSATNGQLYAGPGLGVGGGQILGSHGSCSGPSDFTLQGSSDYIPSDCLPLIGGSGGASSGYQERTGGAGGGAILIAVGGTATVNGLISATGGRGAQNVGNGSGGAVRFAANSFVGSGSIDVLGGGFVYPACAGGVVGGRGQIRIETPDTFAYYMTDIVLTDDIPSVTNPVLGVGTELKLWPDAADPLIRIRSIADQDLLGQVTTGSFVAPDVVVAGIPSLVVNIETRGIDVGSVDMFLRATQKHSSGATAVQSGVGAHQVFWQGTSGGFDQWEVVLPAIPNGYTAYQAYVVFTTP